MDLATLALHIRQALVLILMLSLPVVIISAVVGLVVAFLQAVTQVQDQTTPFAIKLVAAVATLALGASWMGGALFNFGEQMLLAIPAVK
ncbi:type III secretion system export apparatus subunit SctS [Aquabacterium sp. A7-Y]|uniref:type III secretion system export apparatus subunit SctS n=1 Tax=Aquabacterium sp. A7-Y TaxID=1349605 RepID=UPI00223D10FF|nr:type III secretion system export apparatus subunit SctS [Aquabacterium sp. A7-Y]MCW7539740.1 type III secretion system export apparatus subunit SctS [Aquabacterium sp. A7-Y]